MTGMPARHSTCHHRCLPPPRTSGVTSRGKSLASVSLLFHTKEITPGPSGITPRHTHASRTTRPHSLSRLTFCVRQCLHHVYAAASGPAPRCFHVWLVWTMLLQTWVSALPNQHLFPLGKSPAVQLQGNRVALSDPRGPSTVPHGGCTSPCSRPQGTRAPLALCPHQRLFPVWMSAVLTRARWDLAESVTCTYPPNAP